MTRLVLPVALLAAGIALVATPTDSSGCAAVPPLDQRVSVSDESALVVWDEGTKTEHFIRRARFEGTAYDFGFLVPTPSRPQIDEADDSLFADLAALTVPKTVYETREIERELNFGCGADMRGGAAPGNAMMAAGKANAPGGFDVLEQKRVGDLDYAILAVRAGGDAEASAADVLKWLKDHGYAVRPDLVEWIAIYARDKWVLTAFKIAGVPPAVREREPVPPKNGAKDGRSVTLNSTAVRMSFKTERPFFPYREPAGQRVDQTPGAHRLLRVFVAAKQRVAGKLGDGSVVWPGKTVWANSITEQPLTSLHAKGKLPAATEPAAWRVTEFEDYSSPRPGTDEVYFEPAADQSVVERPPHVITTYKYVRTYPWWFPMVVVGGPLSLLIVGGILVRRAWPGK
jgi:hypothetical protein